MRRHRTIGLYLFLGLALAVGGCGLSATDPTGTPPDAPASVDPGDGGGDEGGDGAGIPTIADGRYTGGNARIEVSGDRQMSTDLDLVAAQSITAGVTSLSYLAGAGQESITLQFVLDPMSGAGFNLISGLGMIGGGSSQGCQVDLSRNDGTGISGTLSCREIEGIAAGGIDPLTVDVSISFSADR